MWLELGSAAPHMTGFSSQRWAEIQKCTEMSEAQSATMSTLLWESSALDAARQSVSNLKIKPCSQGPGNAHQCFRSNAIWGNTTSVKASSKSAHPTEELIPCLHQRRSRKLGGQLLPTNTLPIRCTHSRYNCSLP